MATDTFSMQGTSAVQGRFRTIAPWLSRMVMMPPVLVFTLIGTRFLANPGHAVPGVTLNTPESFTDMRVMAAWTITLAAVLLTLISNRKRLWLGHLLLCVFLGLMLAIRIFGFVHDGTTLETGNQMRITVVETVLLILNVLGLVVQNQLRKQIAVRP